MRTNGFIFIAMSFAAVSLAGSPGYLPNVGPIALRFESNAAATPVSLIPTANPVSAKPDEAASPLEVVVDIPAEAPTNSLPNTAALMHNLPVVLPEALTGSTTNSNLGLVGSTVDTNGIVTPQMFIRFFTPTPGGGSREAIIIPATDFTPGRPPTPSSSATYQKTKP